MNDNEVTEKLKELFSDIFDIPKDEIKDDLSPDNTEKWDSFQHLLLISSIEETFNIYLSADDVTEMVSFEKVRNFVLRNLFERN
ncbi:MAG: acyl carrier protein [candidate division WOR-3 bacterium]